MRTLVVLPTYNEIMNVEPMLRTLRKVVPLCDILVVDDASPDGTANLAEEVGEDVGQIKVLRRTQKERTRRRVPRGLHLGTRTRLRPLRRDRLRLQSRPERVADAVRARPRITTWSSARATSPVATSPVESLASPALARG